MEEQIKEMAEAIFQNCNCGIWFSEAEKIARFVIEKQGYRKQKWISVEERLPQKHDEVLVFCDGARQLDFICSDGRWYEHDHKKVTHWMQLPEAPKGGAE